MSKKTLVIGASLKPERYSHKAVRKLRAYGHNVVAYGLRKGKIADIEIDTELKPFDDIHTVTLYVNPQRQRDFYDYVLSLRPKRVIFNPGTENDEFIEILERNGIETIQNCTLVMLGLGIF